MDNWDGEQFVHYARFRRGGVAAHTECAIAFLPTDAVRSVRFWKDVTCPTCLARRRRRGWLITAAMAGVVTLISGLALTGAIISNNEGPTLAPGEVQQTIVARGVRGTISAIELTRTYPTRQIEAATKAVENTRVAHAAIERRTRVARQSADATRKAPAPYSVRVKGLDVICREIAYDYVLMADLGKVHALQYVANMIDLRDSSVPILVSAHDAENALVDCQCFSPRNCKPLN